MSDNKNSDGSTGTLPPFFAANPFMMFGPMADMYKDLDWQKWTESYFAMLGSVCGVGTSGSPFDISQGMQMWNDYANTWFKSFGSFPGMNVYQASNSIPCVAYVTTAQAKGTQTRKIKTRASKTAVRLWREGALGSALAKSSKKGSSSEYKLSDLDEKLLKKFLTVHPCGTGSVEVSLQDSVDNKKLPPGSYNGILYEAIDKAPEPIALINITVLPTEKS